MEELVRLSPDRLRRAEAWLRNPPPGSRAAAARDFGIDLTLLIENLRLTPDERASKLEQMSEAFEQFGGAARRRA
jgi:hypothetical protein